MDDSWTGGLSFTSCIIAFTINTSLQSRDFLLGSELSSYGFIPIGTFERLIGKVLAWSSRTSQDVTSGTICKNLLILRFGSQRFRLMILPELNSIRLDVEGENPMPVYVRVMEMLDSIVRECMTFILVFTMFAVSSSSSAAATTTGVQMQMRIDSSAVFVSKSSVERAVKDADSVLAREDAGVVLSAAQLKSLFVR
jgi:hypothetical protein